MQPAPTTILIVEDDPLIAEVLTSLLEAAGHRVEAAGDGASGLDRILAGGIDLVLLDLMLPEIDGLELCRRVRARESADYVPIIMLTALASDAQRHAGFAAGADDYLTKPCTLEELLDRVRVWLRSRQRQQRGGVPPGASDGTVSRSAEAPRQWAALAREVQERLALAADEADLALRALDAPVPDVDVARRALGLIVQTVQQSAEAAGLLARAAAVRSETERPG
jgi:DNA-binding response OmpR family regulator